MRVFVAAILLCIMIVPQPVAADTWGAAMLAAIWKQTAEKLYDNIQGVILGNLKLMAVQLLNEQIEQLIGGINGSGLLYISDWRQYLFDVPAQQNQLYVNDFLSQTTRGKCSSLNFKSISAGRLNASYFTSLCNQAQASVQYRTPVSNIDEFSTDPARSLAEGNWRVMNAMFANPANNPLGLALMTQQAQQADLTQRTEARKAEGVANQGFNSVKVGGVTVTPGRTVADMISNVKTLGNNILMAAENPAEFLSGLIVTVANRAINQLMQRGFEKAREVIQKEMAKVNQQIYRATSQINKVIGPAGQYLTGVNQQLGGANSTLQSIQATGKYTLMQNPATCNNGDCP